jgi:hypothetical protein
MKGGVRRFATEWITAIEDVTSFVARQREHASPSNWDELRVPRERTLTVDADLARTLRLG